ncbi:unnamed protein product [Didymodactylos carnosus]|uniref:Uncharacterized protein n=1 Tax=Didymodactylos carnosus TaxID=1234261 RepID=A0A8S2CMT5_9BILA|nr:unnamed protein product [Didymodactylos carnosus]CAF3491771.1 unnamed protein product [Didymodactylos carnosus]
MTSTKLRGLRAASQLLKSIDERVLTIIVGAPGSGKSVVALEAVRNALQNETLKPNQIQLVLPGTELRTKFKRLLPKSRDLILLVGSRGDIGATFFRKLRESGKVQRIVALHDDHQGAGFDEVFVYVPKLYFLNDRGQVDIDFSQINGTGGMNEL